MLRKTKDLNTIHTLEVKTSWPRGVGGAEEAKVKSLNYAEKAPPCWLILCLAGELSNLLIYPENEMTF